MARNFLGHIYYALVLLMISFGQYIALVFKNTTFIEYSHMIMKQLRNFINTLSSVLQLALIIKQFIADSSSI